MPHMAQTPKTTARTRKRVGSLPAEVVRATQAKRVAINITLPKAVHRALRVKAVEKELTLEQAITVAVEAWNKTR